MRHFKVSQKKKKNQTLNKIQLKKKKGLRAIMLSKVNWQIPWVPYIVVIQI